MSIQQLPDHVIAQIKSSTTITSLNGVVCGLIKNSLDAGATKITISIDYNRGNCSVEDNGLGIPPDEFGPTGGLGRPHYTSKYPARGDTHGRYGAFLASVAALSLLSITSHHHNYHSHNSIKIHNAEVLARHTPSLPEQRLLSFPHGTRTTVRDLFGSMPVRVKQRAIDAERGLNAKDWEHLKRALVALLLAWPGQVSIPLRDSIDQRSITLRTPEEPPASRDKLHDIIGLTTRVSRIFFQAQLCDDRSRDLWVPLKASAGSVSVVGAISLAPVASRNMQFISIGVRPVSNDHGSNVLYEEVNRLFANSSFGVEDEGGELNEHEQNRRAKDRRFKTEGFTNQELKGRKGVDRWPMFHVKIEVGQHTSRFAERDVEEILDERNESLKTIIEVLTAVIYEFLKANHFRPKYYRPRRSTASRRSDSRDERSKSLSRSSTPKTDSQTGCSHTPRGSLSIGDLASTRLNLASNNRLRPESPFDSWTRVKSGQPQYAHLHDKSPNPEATSESGQSKSGSQIGTGRPSNDGDALDTPLVAPDGTLLRIPFLDVDMEGRDAGSKNTFEEDNLNEDKQQIQEGEEVLWTNPASRETFAVNSRNGLVIRSVRSKTDGNGAIDNLHRPPIRKKLRTNTRPVPKDERSQWLGDLLASWNNPVFQSQEPPIPMAFDEAKVLALASKASDGCCHGLSSKTLDFIQASQSVEGRLTKESLRYASIIAQVDYKFILAKVPLSTSLQYPNKSEDINPTLLIAIDQHAADERCRVEALMKDYFMIAEDLQDGTTGQRRQLICAQAELLESPIIFDISVQDCRQFERSAEYFQHWGIVFRVISILKSELDSKRTAKLKVVKLPPSIAERCRSEPRLLIELLRKEAWKFDEQGFSASQPTGSQVAQDDDDNSTGIHWLSRLHGCPQGILEMINSRACRSSIMFNDLLSPEACIDLVERLANCALPFQCAHGRPSMVPLVDIGNSPMSVEDTGKSESSFGQAFKGWRSSMGN
ncbi:uncharacterized protein F4822DRAFT_251162 [Hypoxylon trugodes]|uniref:uncharacterized protein n=1 Tax=Hypoxylon trugodes TaxID=326681 RepID=UPI002197EF2E|nr:uncharacterized protein F4822DRAFT_251162 [Hypoxylon trugodes]KAI1388596.1 hypothetical protein F4822DRAFT_251162 [Hypoxylon trugodes]